MRVAFIVLLVCVVACSAQKDKFTAKLKKLAVVFYNQKDLGKITDAVIEDVRLEKSIDAIASNFMNVLVANTAITQYGKLLSLMTGMNKCLAGTGVDTLGLLEKVSPVFVNKLTKPYKEIIKKMKTMKSSGKTKVQQTNQAYVMATAVLTKNLVQSIVTGCANKLTVKQWNCALQYLPTLIAINQYDCKKKN